MHFDEIANLGSFVEIEAGNISNPEISVDTLREQCEQLMQHFNIKEEDLIESSYSGMLLEKE